MRRLLSTFLVLALAGCAGLPYRAQTRQRLDALKADAAAGKHDSVIKALSGDAVSRMPRFARPEAYYLRGKSLRLNGNPGAALETFQLAEGLYPKNLNILTELATVLHNIGLDERALPHYRRILKIHPNNPVANQGIAEILRAEGNLAQAQFHFERALKEPGWDKNTRLWLDYGSVLAARGVYDTAAEAMQQAIALDRSADSLLALARVERARGRAGQSHEYLAEAILLDPAREEALIQRGLWELADADLSAAFATAELILSGEEDNALARWLRASVHLRRGQKEEAAADLAVAAAAVRNHPFIAATARAMLERMMGNP